MDAENTAKLNADETVLLRADEGGIATLTLNRPKAFNALSEELLAALQMQLETISNDSSVRVVVIEGSGDAFCAGHDLKQMRANPSREYYDALFNTCSQFMLTLMRIPQPVIAKVHGIATAAGCQLVGTCDLAIASEEAKFATSGINYGLFCSTPAVAVSRNIHRKKAAELLFTGEFIDARTAESFGLINKAVPAKQLNAEVIQMANLIIRKSAVAVSTGKRMLYRQIEMGIDDAYKFAAETMACNMMAFDAGEGIDAFIEKRSPTWKHI
ncbi:MAG: enoyl-CoA hydratase [Proteobacteria bacterium]|jgi:enoyl-CoA hydratase/carnithine racemase|nr:enoyl-CoA hydratase [Pseudomonadota bacterium]MDA1011789.1 enoyl-CoA hydratase [Pseudomonadota bacterium]|tara:strand:+ start:1007 stop:1816 length:810 start_codon:yes stop_codon:yes gene_type:complete